PTPPPPPAPPPQHYHPPHPPPSPPEPPAPHQAHTAPTTRATALDMMKGWLTIFMVLSHLTYVVPFRWSHKFNIYVNLTSFSGFMFCFGYACWKAYIEKEREDVAKRLGKGAFKSLLAFYICGLGSYIRGTLQDWESVLFLQRLPGMTEFLFSFCLMYLMILIFRKQLKRLTWGNGAVISVISLAVTAAFPFDIVSDPIIGSIFGTASYYSFPLIAYLGYFIVGCLLAKYQIVFVKWLFLITCILTAAFFNFCRANGILPGRFPPTVWWICGGSLFIYFYFLIFKLVSQEGIDIKPLIFIGKHTLVFLVVSNMLLFILWNHLIDERLWETVSMNRWELRYMIFITITFIISWGVIKINEKCRGWIFWD
ncbi:MAG: hypothetical protein K2K90_04625, partial [Lachnospiraceae bacterium]|nr:hypothetical protein [Lachnospiraceae bacterium]